MPLNQLFTNPKTSVWLCKSEISQQEIKHENSNKQSHTAFSVMHGLLISQYISICSLERGRMACWHSWQLKNWYHTTWKI